MAVNEARLPLPLFMVLNWLIPVGIASVALPLVMVGVIAMAASDRVGSVIDHGELFLVAGNAVVTSSALLVSNRSERTAGWAVAIAIMGLLVVTVPSYGSWAYLSTQSRLGAPYSVDFATEGGMWALTMAMVVSYAFVRVAARAR